MSDKCAKKTSRKDSATAERNTQRNRARRVARDAKFKAAKALTATKRRKLRAKGALARIERRIKVEQDGQTCLRLNQIRTGIERKLRA